MEQHARTTEYGVEVPMIRAKVADLIVKERGGTPAVVAVVLEDGGRIDLGIGTGISSDDPAVTSLLVAADSSRRGVSGWMAQDAGLRERLLADGIMVEASRSRYIDASKPLNGGPCPECGNMRIVDVTDVVHQRLGEGRRWYCECCTVAWLAIVDYAVAVNHLAGMLAVWARHGTSPDVSTLDLDAIATAVLAPWCGRWALVDWYHDGSTAADRLLQAAREHPAST